MKNIEEKLDKGGSHLEWNTLIGKCLPMWRYSSISRYPEINPILMISKLQSMKNQFKINITKIPNPCIITKINTIWCKTSINIHSFHFVIYNGSMMRSPVRPWRVVSVLIKMFCLMIKCAPFIRDSSPLVSFC